MNFNLQDFFLSEIYIQKTQIWRILYATTKDGIDDETVQEDLWIIRKNNYSDRRFLTEATSTVQGNQGERIPNIYSDDRQAVVGVRIVDAKQQHSDGVRIPKYRRDDVIKRHRLLRWKIAVEAIFQRERPEYLKRTKRSIRFTQRSDDGNFPF